MFENYLTIIFWLKDLKIKKFSPEYNKMKTLILDILKYNSHNCKSFVPMSYVINKVLLL